MKTVFLRGVFLLYVALSNICGADFSEIENQIVEAHNFYRAKHGVKHLIPNQNISNYAQNWAQYLADKKLFHHRLERIYGENLFLGFNIDNIGKEAVKYFYEEIGSYNYSDPGFSIKTGHFTQVVWKKSKEIGIGVAETTDNYTVIVMNYKPPGNFNGEFEENVLRPV